MDRDIYAETKGGVGVSVYENGGRLEINISSPLGDATFSRDEFAILRDLISNASRAVDWYGTDARDA